MDCDEEREGYLNRPRPAYPAIHAVAAMSKRERTASLRIEETLGAFITVAGGAWAVYVVTLENANLWQLRLSPPSPLVICALGILIWLHAKWRHSAKTD